MRDCAFRTLTPKVLTGCRCAIAFASGSDGTRYRAFLGAALGYALAGGASLFASLEAGMDWQPAIRVPRRPACGAASEAALQAGKEVVLTFPSPIRRLPCPCQKARLGPEEPYQFGRNERRRNHMPFAWQALVTSVRDELCHCSCPTG